MSTDLRDYARINVATWNRTAGNWVEAGERLWASDPEWGIWGFPKHREGLAAYPDYNSCRAADPRLLAAQGVSDPSHL